MIVVYGLSVFKSCFLDRFLVGVYIMIYKRG